MKIKVRNGKLRLVFYLPLGFIKSRFAYWAATKIYAASSEKRPTSDTVSASACLSNSVSEEQQSLTNEAENQSTKNCLPISRELLREVYRSLKKCRKAVGHFDLVNVHSVDDDGAAEVKITV